MTVTAAPRTRHPSLRIAVLIGSFLLLGLIGLGVVSIAAWMADPCSPECTSASGSSYADLQEAVLGLGGLVYLAATIPLAILRARRIVWLVPVCAFLLVTVGGVAILASGAEGGPCDCGYGVKATSVTAFVAWSSAAPSSSATRAARGSIAVAGPAFPLRRAATVGQTSPSLPPKLRNRRPHTFSLQLDISEGPRDGAVIAFLDPWQAGAEMVCAHTPRLWPYRGQRPPQRLPAGDTEVG